MKLPLLLVLAVMSIGVVTSTVRAAMIVNGGILHASATAFNSPNSTSDNPPDKPVVLPSTSIVAEAIATGNFGTSRGHVDVTAAQSTGGTITLDGNTFITNFFTNTGGTIDARASSTGQIAFSEATVDTIAISSSLSSDFMQGTVQLNDANGATVAFLTNGKKVSLSPGQYTINWSLGGQTMFGSGGAASFHFAASSVPEPTVAWLLILLLPSWRIRGKGLPSRIAI